jgi:hypothetical protein
MTFADDFPGTMPFFNWCGQTAVSKWIQDSTQVFPFTETIHILALAVLLGVILLMDLRLLGVGVKNWTPSRLSEQLNRFIPPSLALILFTGLILFISEPDKCATNPAFFWKIVLLVLAIGNHYLLHHKAQRITTAQVPVWGKAIALASILLWFGVGVMGRAIGFV